jgi:cellulose synthase/poly-beta-1,6-N-acetylglucosamine synthase-like glycosyltransferase
MVHLPELAAPTELPRSMRSYRAQQRRWTRGNAQVLRASWRDIVRSNLPLRHRATMLLRTAARVLYLFLAILTIGMPLTTFVSLPWRVHYTASIDAAIFGVVIAALYAYYLPALHRATGSIWRGVVIVPAVMALHIGLSMCCTVSFIAGLVRRDAEFVRIPKLGDHRAGPTYALPADPFAVLELALGVAYLGFAGLALARHLALYALFFAFWAASYLWVGVGTMVARD